MANLNGLFTLGRSAELRTTGGGDSVTTLALAYNYGRKGEDGKKPTQWIEAALWGKQAEALAQYLEKGKQVSCAISDVHIETYAKNDGGQGTKLVGRILDIELARGGGQQSSNDGYGQQEQRPAQRQAPAPRQQQAAPAPRQGGGGFEDMDDSIPFRDPMSKRGFHLVV